MDGEGMCDVRALAELLKPDGNESPDSDQDLPDPGLTELGPGLIGKKSEKSSKKLEKLFAVKTRCGEDISDVDEDSTSKNEAKYIPDECDIWRDDELENRTTGEERWDPREQPEYNIKYRQAVTTQDLYLRMGSKTTSTASCEDMIVTIHLDGETSRGVIDLTLTNTQLHVRSPLYRFCLHLPQPIDPETGNAVWNKEESTLEVTLRMARDLDLINF